MLVAHHPSRPPAFLLSLLAVALFLLGLSGPSFAGQLTLAWNAVANATGYKVHFGQNSGSYTSSVDAGNKLTQTVTGLGEGTRYYFVVTAYGPPGTSESNYSNQVSGVVPTTTAAPPVASFTASPTSGTAPLLVALNDTSTGSVTSRSWSLGDGTTATSSTVNKTYSNAGTYTVRLTVTGSGGSTTATRTITVSAPSGGGGSGGGTGGTSGLVASYSFEETSGSQATDASGNANHGIISGATRIASGRFGRALRFDGVNDSVAVDHSASLNLTNRMTLWAWVYPTASKSTPATILMKEASGTASYRIYTNFSGSRPTSMINIGGATRTVSGGPVLPLNAWSHVAATYDGATHRLYVNGTLVSSQPQTGSIDASTGKLRIGGNSVWGYYFAGYIDEVRVYNRALTQSEIAADSNAGGSGSSGSEIIIDNASAGVADTTRQFTGTWCASEASGAYGSGSLYSCGSGVDTYRWTPVIGSAETYDVYVRWTQHPNRATGVPVTVRHASGTVTKRYNEQAGGGAWVLFGRYSFNAGTAGYVQVSDEGKSGQAAADAVRFVRATSSSSAPAAGEIIIDNAAGGAADATRGFTGTWCVSSAPGAFGANSLYSCGGGLDTYRWTPAITTSGAYDVYVRWTQHPNRSTGVPIAVRHTGGTTSRSFNEQTGGATWVRHGRYNFNAGTSGYVEVRDSAGQAAADAVRFVPAQ